jgi:hypothetical protein
MFKHETWHFCELLLFASFSNRVLNCVAGSIHVSVLVPETQWPERCLQMIELASIVIAVLVGLAFTLFMDRPMKTGSTGLLMKKRDHRTH